MDLSLDGGCYGGCYDLLSAFLASYCAWPVAPGVRPEGPRRRAVRGGAGLAVPGVRGVVVVVVTIRHAWVFCW